MPKKSKITSLSLEQFEAVMNRSVQLLDKSYKRLYDIADLDKLAIDEVIKRTQQKKIKKMEEMLEKSEEVED